MQVGRDSALTELKRLAENLQSCSKVLPSRAWEEEINQMFLWAHNDGTKSSLPEINKRIEDIKSKVRDRLTILFFSIPFIYLICLFFCRNPHLENSC